MDCCPIMVSDLPVLCSRIDGVVTVVKTEQSNSPYYDLFWGKFHCTEHRLDVNTLSGGLSCSHSGCNDKMMSFQA